MMSDARTGSTQGATISRGRRPATPSTASADSNLTPVRELTQYMGSRWRIKARVVGKGPIREFKNARGDGKLCKLDLVDREGGEISGTLFGKAVDQFFNVVSLNEVYYFSKGSIKPANKKWDKGDYVISFGDDSVIDPVGEDSSIPGKQYHFRQLREIALLEANT